MLLALLVACLAPADTAEYVYTGEAWRPVVAGWIDGNAKCGTMEGPCFDCVEVQSNLYMRWEYDDDTLTWTTRDYGVHHEVTPGDGSCEAIRLGAPLP